MGIIDDIKARLDIVDEIGNTVKLKRTGKNYLGLCPFHTNTRTPAFVVFAGTQTWHCFGSCNTGGDIFDFYMKKNGDDFQETLRLLAEKAHVELRPLSATEQQQVTLRREREATLGAVMAYFQKRMNAPQMFPVKAEDLNPGLLYAVYIRRFTLETIHTGYLGYFGKDWNGLRAHLQEAQIDLESPAAVAFIGFQGDVEAWGQKWQIAVARGWIEDKKIPAMPPDMLIYAHSERGRIAYLSGRKLNAGEGEAKSWNPPRELLGEKRPMFNQVWFQPGEPEVKNVVIVEGQANGWTLGQWKIQAVSLAGSDIGDLCVDSRNSGGTGSSDNLLLSELKRKTERKNGNRPATRIVIGLDNDKTGHEKTPKAIEALLAAGFSPVQIATVDWPKKDPNDWLQEGGTASAAIALLAQADTVLESLIGDAEPVDGGKSDEEAVQKLFAELAKMSPFEVERAREEICRRLNMRMRVFDGLLKAARRDAGQGEDGQPAYFVEGGRIFARYFDQRGGETVEALCNFNAEISGDVLRDNGQDIIREFHIRGSIGKHNLPLARVKADEFSKMDWVLSAWGSRAIIEAGSRRRDQLRAALQHLSKEVERKVIYTHTGWREFDTGKGANKRIYLTVAGAVGGENVEVELDRDLELYSIPPVAQDPAGAMKLSLAFLDIAPDEIAFPIWGAMWLPPLRDLINVAFAMWVYGGSGAMKSTYCALAMNHYGPTFDDKHLPASFIDSANRLEQKSFVVKDAPLIIDDYAPQKESRSAQMYIQAAHRIVRAAGNLAGRGRLNADSTAKTTYDPRSLVIITGEDLPESESLVARMFVVEMNKGDVDKAKLTALQNQRGRLCHAMSGFLSWASMNWQGWSETIPARWREYRQRGFEAGYHLRVPEAMAGLMLGIEMGLRYALTLSVIDSARYADLLERGWAALRTGAATMSERVTEEKPENLFLRTLSDLITQGKVFLKQGEGLATPLGGPADHSEMLGWYDHDRLYLLPEATYNRIARHFRDQGNVFPVRESTLRKALAEAGVIETEVRTTRIETEDGPQTKTETRRTIAKNLEGQTRRVMVVLRKYLQDGDEK